MLWTTIDGRQQYVPQFVARQLANRAGLVLAEDDDSDPVNGLVQAYLASRRTGRNWPYIAISQITNELNATPPPAALLKLAELPFRLFVSTTTDRYLQRALDDVRFEGRQETVVLPYGLGGKADLPDRSPDRRTTVFPLLGLANASPDYAVTDEDVLEFVHRFHSTGTPKRLLDTLRQRHLLLIGGGFSDWLLRFLVRLTKPDRLWGAAGSQMTAFVADPEATADRRLRSFLEHPLSDTELFSTEHAISFVDQLHMRWKARHPHGDTAPWNDVTPGLTDVAVGRRIFLSYCHEDYDSACRIRDMLDGAGIDVWFDKRDLDPGDDFAQRISTQIEKSHFFIAVVSRHWLTPEPRFLHLEWRKAEAHAGKVPPTISYVIPIAVDDTSHTDDRLPPFIRGLHWSTAPNGELPSDVVDSLVRRYRDAQRS